jgi:hypothetical protein
MDHFAGSDDAADTELQMFILSRLADRRRGSVVSVNALIGEIHASLPECPLSDDRLAEVIMEAAMLLGLVPVFDPDLPPECYDASGAIRGYGHRAHRPDPSATYGFDPGAVRTLPAAAPSGPDAKPSNLPALGIDATKARTG